MEEEAQGKYIEFMAILGYFSKIFWLRSPSSLKYALHFMTTGSSSECLLEIQSQPFQKYVNFILQIFIMEKYGQRLRQERHEIWSFKDLASPVILEFICRGFLGNNNRQCGAAPRKFCP